jgi:Leucine-rich repeat (LRR) protein
MSYVNVDATQTAADTAAAWPRLPQLRELVLSFTGDVDNEPLSQQQWEAICSSVSACSALTKLQLTIDEYSTEELQQVMTDGEPAGLAFCAKLAGLTNLKELDLEQSHLAPGDALALTALTGLTRLAIGQTGRGVDDFAATAIASSCQQLRYLTLSQCDLGSMACLAAVGNLTQLTGLWLDGNEGLTRQGLMLLTGLKQLQVLGIDRHPWVLDPGVTEESVNSFWAAVRQ